MVSLGSGLEKHVAAIKPKIRLNRRPGTDILRSALPRVAGLRPRLNTMFSVRAMFTVALDISIQGDPMTAVVSIADLERQLEERRNQVQELYQQRERVQEELERIDAELQHIAAGGSVRRTKRPRNSVSLKALVPQILGKHKKGLSLDDLVAKIRESGYASHSAKFKNVVYQNLYNSEVIDRDTKTGLYKLKK